MAFGARELRLILSIQSYGTGNIARMRRDLMQLAATTKGANAMQIATGARAAKMQDRIFATQQRIARLDKQLSTSQGTRALERRAKLIAQLPVTMGRATLRKALAGDERTLARLAPKTQAILNDIRAIDLHGNTIAADLAKQNTLLGLQKAAVDDILGTEMARAVALDKQIGRMEMLERRELRLRGYAHIGRTAQFAGLVGLAALGVAGTSFANFNQQVTLAATQARKINRPLSDIPILAKAIADGVHQGSVQIEGILDLMQQFPASGDDMAKAAYDIFSSMDVSFGGGMKLLKQFNHLAVATGSDLATAVDAGITVLNNFGRSSGTVNDRLNLMVTTIRFGRMRLADLNAMLQKVAPAATASGQRLQDVAGAMVAITRLQPSQRVGATGIARLLQTFRDPDFQRGADKLGVNITRSATGVGRLKPLPEIIKAFAENFRLFQRYGGPSQLFKELTATGRGTGQGRQSRIEATNAYVFLVGHAKEYLELQAKTTKDTGEFSKALKAMAASPGVRWQIFLNQLRAFVLVIGEAALPALLQLADHLKRAFEWLRNLNEGTRNWIVRAGVFVSAALLVVGTLGNMVFTIGAAITMMQVMSIQSKIMTGDLEGARTSAVRFNIAMKTLAAIGLIAIPIVLQVIKGGDPSGWDLLMAAGFGAMAGAQFGWQGAVIGAITVPVIVKFISERQAFAKAQKDFGAIAKQLGMDFGKEIDFGEMAKLNEFLKTHPAAAAAAEKKIAMRRLKDQTSLYKEYLKNGDKFNAEQIKKLMDQSKNLNDAYQQQGNQLSAAQQRELAMRKAHADAVKQAMQQQEQLIKTATDNIMNLYDKFMDQNKQALGSIGQGPVMQGILGNIFTGLNDMLRQFGIQIPVPFAILKQDLDMQLTYFKRWRKDLNDLLKRGAPLELVQEIQAMGPNQGMSLAEGLLGAPKKQFNKYKSEWTQGQKLLETATKKDLDAQLQYWLQYGKDAAWQTIMGIINNPKNAQIRKMYAGYVKRTYSDVLKREFTKAVNEQMAQAAQDWAAANPPSGGGGGGGKGGKGRGRGGVVPPSKMTRAQAQQALRTVNATEARLYAKLQTEPSVGVGENVPLSPTAKAYNAAVRREAAIRARLRTIRHQDYLNVRSQIRQQRQGHVTNPIVIYHGDTYHVSATLTAKEFMRLVQRQEWRKRHKVHRKP